MAPDPVVRLTEELRTARLLEPAQLNEVTATLAAPFPEPRALARELVRRGWLTSFQVNALFQGRGYELLLGSYVLLDKIGEGGMGAVFKARNWKLGKTVAVKVIRQKRLGSAQSVRRFQREIRAAARLDHPHIVHAHDADAVGETLLLVMEYVEGGTDLARLVKKHGPLPVAEACAYVRQAALGLQHAHERGLVHRDVKPSNLLRSAAGIVKVLDLGLAHLDHSGEDDSSSVLTQEGMVMGTFNYIAPEQAADASTVDSRADLYSLGCTLYYLLTGRVPFPGGKPVEKLYRHRFEERAPLEQLRPDVSAEVTAVVRRLMAKQPDERYPTAAAAAAALERAAPEVVPALAAPARGLETQSESSTQEVFARLLDSETPAPLPPSAGQGSAGRSRRWWVGAAGCVLVLLAAAVLLVLLGRGRLGTPEEPPVAATVDINRPWQDTGVEVRAGQPVRVRVTGGWERKERPSSVLRTRESGTWDRPVAQELPARCLLGRVGDNGVAVNLEMGPGFVPDTSGRLFVQVNDLDLEELTGTLQLDIQAGRRAHEALAPPPPLASQAAELQLNGLEVREADPQTDRAALWTEVVGTRRAGASTRQDLRAVDLLHRLPSPLDRLDPAEVPLTERAAAGGGDPEKAPTGLTAVLTAGPAGPATFAALALSADGTSVVAAGGTKVCVWDLQRREAVRVLAGPTASTGCMALSGDGRLLVLGGQDGTIDVRPLSGDGMPAISKVDFPVTALAMSADGRQLAVGGKDGWVAVLDLVTGTRVDVQEGHSGRSNSVALSPDGRYLASAGEDRTVRLWDTATGRPARVISGEHEGPVVRVAFHPYERLLASLGDGGRLNLWTVPDGQRVGRFMVDAACVDMTFGPDGRTLAVVDGKGSLALWDLASGKQTRAWQLARPTHGVAFAADGRHLLAIDGGTVCVLRLGPPAAVARPWRPPADSAFDSLRHDIIPADELRSSGGGDPAKAPPELVAVLGDTRLRPARRVFRIAWSPDGKRLASASHMEPVRVWDTVTGRELLSINANTSGAGAVAFSPDGKRLVIGFVDGKVTVRDPETGKELHPAFQAHAGPIRDIAFSPDSKRLATAADDHLVKVWDTAAWQEVCKCRGHISQSATVAFSPDGQRLAAAGPEKTVRIWEAASGREVFVLRDGNSGYFMGVAFAPDGTHLVAACDDGRLHAWDTKTGQVLPAGPVGAGSVVFHPKGDGLATLHLPMGPVAMLDPTGGKEVLSLFAVSVTTLKYSPDGERLAAADTYGCVHIWDLKKGKEVPLSAAHRGPVYGVAVSPDGTRVLSRSNDLTIRCWDSRTGRPLFAVPVRPPGGSTLALSPDGKVLFCDSDTRMGIKARDAVTGRELWSLPPTANALRKVLVSPDGTRVASLQLHEKVVRIWDAATGCQVQALEGSADLTCAEFSPDSRRLVVEDSSGQVVLWDLARERRLWEVSVATASHPAAAFCPDGRQVAVGCPGGVVRLFEVESGKDVGRLTLPEDKIEISSLAFHPGGRTLAVGSDSGRLTMWETATERKQEWRLPGIIYSVAFAADGRHVLAGSSNGCLYVLRPAPQ
jgi:serine/threonine-protein kinase